MQGIARVRVWDRLIDVLEWFPIRSNLCAAYFDAYALLVILAKARIQGATARRVAGIPAFELVEEHGDDNDRYSLVENRSNEAARMLFDVADTVAAMPRLRNADEGGEMTFSDFDPAGAPSTPSHREGEGSRSAGLGASGSANDALAAISRASLDGIIIADRFGQVRSFNREAETIFGYPAAEVIDRNLQFLMPDARQSESDPYLDYLMADQDTGELRIIGMGREVAGRRKDGSTVALELSIVEGRGVDGLRCFTSVIRDITQRQMHVRELQNAIEEARQARLDAESANRAKTEFLAVMSHEIRTPITTISGFVDLLTASGTLTHQQRRYVDLVKTANAALLTIVNDILDFSKVEAGQLELEMQPFSPTSLINDAVGIVLWMASAKDLSIGYEIDSEVPEWLTGDQARLRQVLLNLLNNAIKFTEEGSIKVEVRAQTSADGLRRIRFSVTDTGIGIPAEKQHRLFKTFSQADSSVSRRHGGTGLGLAICKRLVELMGGEIGIVSDVGRGATVWFTADLHAATQPPVRAQKAPPPSEIDTSKSRILVVDDIDTNREIVHAFLTDSGYQVDTVDNAADAIQMIRDDKYDLVLMDVQMPDMDGVAATRVIRALPGAVKNIPIIAMTGNVLPRQVSSFLDAGMNDHVGKPIERGKLYKNVFRWLPPKKDREGRPFQKSPHFNEAKYEQFVRILGVAKAEPAAARFLEQVTAAFKTNSQIARCEAHVLINSAGLFGFDGLVAACLAIDDATSNDAEIEPAKFDEARRAQFMARQTLVGHVLPNLRGALLRPTG